MAAVSGLLLFHLARDVGRRPLYEDEAITGLIAMRPLREVLDTVVVDRGGAPIHFVLAHLVFSFDASYAALRWLSVLLAVASVPLCFDLGRRLGGLWAGLVAAAVVASSTALAIYGSFGRMYALFVFVAALFGVLFVRALDRPTTGTVAAASAAGWLLPAVHPYGADPGVRGARRRRGALAPPLARDRDSGGGRRGRGGSPRARRPAARRARLGRRRRLARARLARRSLG